MRKSMSNAPLAFADFQHQISTNCRSPVIVRAHVICWLKGGEGEVCRGMAAGLLSAPRGPPCVWLLVVGSPLLGVSLSGQGEAAHGGLRRGERGSHGGERRMRMKKGRGGGQRWHPYTQKK